MYLILCLYQHPPLINMLQIQRQFAISAQRTQELFLINFTILMLSLINKERALFSLHFLLIFYISFPTLVWIVKSPLCPSLPPYTHCQDSKIMKFSNLHMHDLINYSYPNRINSRYTTYKKKSSEFSYQ